MRLADFALPTDENIDAAVVKFLREFGFDVADVSERNWHGRSDAALLADSFAEQRVVVTHDADFGRWAVLERKSLLGIVYLRPGHIDPQFTIDTIKVLLAGKSDVEPPFVVVAKRSADRVAVRIRQLPIA